MEQVKEGKIIPPAEARRYPCSLSRWWKLRGEVQYTQDNTKQVDARTGLEEYLSEAACEEEMSEFGDTIPDLMFGHSSKKGSQASRGINFSGDHALRDLLRPSIACFCST